MKTKNILLVVVLLAIPFVNFQAGQWVKKKSLGGVARHRATGVSIGQKGYIGLGHVNGTGVNFAFSDWWEYDPATNSWTQKADYLLGQGYGAAAFSIGTKGYVGSGVYTGNSWCEYNPSTNQWSLIATPAAASSELTAFTVNEKGYLVEGSSIYEYDPTIDQWTQKTSAPVGFSSWACSFSTTSSGFVYKSDLFYEYKPSIDQWAARAPFPGLTDGGAAAFSLLGKGYIVAGYGGSGWLSDVNRETWRFDPGTNTWEIAEEFPGSSRRFVVGFSIGDRGYIGTGTNGTNFKDFWQYDPLLMGLEEIKNDLSVDIYPNPASEYFTIRINEKGASPGLLSTNSEFLLYDNLGKVVKQSEVNGKEINIDVTNLPNGNYTYQLISDSQSIEAGKIIVVK